MPVAGRTWRTNDTKLHRIIHMCILNSLTEATWQLATQQSSSWRSNALRGLRVEGHVCATSNIDPPSGTCMNVVFTIVAWGPRRTTLCVEKSSRELAAPHACLWALQCAVQVPMRSESRHANSSNSQSQRYNVELFVTYSHTSNSLARCF